MIARIWRRPSIRITFVVVVLAIVAGIASWRLADNRPSPSAYFQAGVKAYRSGDRASLREAMDSLEEYSGFQQHAHVLRAADAVLNQSIESAFRRLSFVKPVGELREPWLLIVGEAYYRVGRLSDAQRMFATLTREQPEDTDAHRWLAAIAYDLGAFTDAIKELDIVTAQNPDDYRPYITKGYMYADTEQYSMADTVFSAALSKRPPDTVRAELISDLAKVKLKLRNYDGVLETLSQADPSPFVLALKAESLLGLGRSEDARSLVDEALRIEPREIRALALSGKMYLDSNLPEMAIPVLHQVLDLDPHEFESRYQLAQALRLTGQENAADEESKLWKKDVEMREELATLTESAIQNPRDADVREKIAALCSTLGKPELAKTWLNAAKNCRSTVSSASPSSR